LNPNLLANRRQPLSEAEHAALIPSDVINNYVVRWSPANHDNVVNQLVRYGNNSFVIQNQPSHLTSYSAEKVAFGRCCPLLRNRFYNDYNSSSSTVTIEKSSQHEKRCLSLVFRIRAREDHNERHQSFPARAPKLEAGPRPKLHFRELRAAIPGETMGETIETPDQSVLLPLFVPGKAQGHGRYPKRSRP
jgi:hypothetical protein